MECSKLVRLLPLKTSSSFLKLVQIAQTPGAHPSPSKPSSSSQPSPTSTAYGRAPGPSFTPHHHSSNASNPVFADSSTPKSAKQKATSLSVDSSIPLDNKTVQIQKQEILASIRLEELDAKDPLKIKNLFRDKSRTQVAKRIWLSWAIALGAPLYGGNIIVFHSSSIFAALGIDNDTLRILTASLQSAAPVGMLSAFYLLQRFGRRPLLVWGGTGQLSMTVLFTILSNLGDKATPTTRWVSVAALYVFQTINSMTWIWLPYLYGVEIVPTR